MRALRRAWRTLREASALRWFIIEVDRLWWATVINRADIVDLDHVRAQQPMRSARAAVRSYVRGGHRRGLSLNPLFVEAVVSAQLSDAGRVPALYAYLVNDVSAIEVAGSWSAVAYAARHPDSLSSPGGPLGHAWRSARRSGTFVLGSGLRERAVSWREVQKSARTAVSSTPAAFDGAQGVDGHVIAIIRVAASEAHSLDALRAADALSIDGAHVLVALDERAKPDVRVDCALAGLAQSAMSVRRDRDDWGPAIDSAIDRSGVVLVRGPGAEISIDDLRALASRASVETVSPLWLSDDGTVASAGWYAHAGTAYPLLAGHPSEDARLLGKIVPSLAPSGQTFAMPLAASGGSVVHTDLTVRAAGRAVAAPTQAEDTDIDALLAPAGFRVDHWTVEGPTLVSTRARDPQRLRWAIRTSAPAGPPGEAWGDTHFARGLADALRRLGQEVVIDSYAARNRPSAYLDDVVLCLRGPEPIEAQPGARSLLWIISHPDQISAAELSGFSRVFAGSARWAADASARFGIPVQPLLQCTDVHRFHPSGLTRTQEVVFVGTARGIARPSIVEPLRAGIPVSVYGPDWRGYIPGSAIKGLGIPNRDLPQVYESARAVLNDHWPAMQANGFVSNRLYDVVAAGGRAISDDVEGIEEIFRGAVLTYRTIPELLALLSGDLDARFPDEPTLSTIAADVRRAHSFDARARVLLDAALAAPQPDAATLT